MEAQAEDEVSDEREERLRMISDSAAKVLGGHRARARRLRFGESVIERSTWSQFAEQGWTAMRVPEDRGGLGMGTTELAEIARQLGRELVPEPIQWTALLAPLLSDDGLEPVVTGERIVLPAFAPFGADPVAASSDGLSGETDVIAFASCADIYLVQTASGAALVEAGTDGLTVETIATHDGGHLGKLILDKAACTPLEADMDVLREEGAVVHAAYLLGVAEAAFEITLAYVKDRQQFGKPIGAFQVLQHMMVDRFLDLNLARAACNRAARRLDEASVDDEARRIVSLAREQASRTARAITQTSIQLHGGIGYTDEADIGLYLRKTMTLSGLFGTERFHLARTYRLREA